MEFRISLGRSVNKGLVSWWSMAVCEVEVMFARGNLNGLGLIYLDGVRRSVAWWTSGLIPDSGGEAKSPNVSG